MTPVEIHRVCHDLQRDTDLVMSPALLTRVREACADHAALVERTTWRPIADAPKDTSLLVRIGSGEFHIATYHTYADPSSHDPDGWWGLDSSYTVIELEPTHWMPLSAPPEAGR